MLFDQVRSIFSFSNKQKTRKGGKRRLFLLPPSKEEAIRLAIQESEKLREARKLKDAIQVLDRSIQNGKISNKLLLNKALLLSSDKQFEESQKILKSLSKIKSDPDISSSAKEALKTIRHLETEIKNSKILLLTNMHALAEKNNQKLICAPKPNQLSAEHDLAIILRKEAANARNNNRFKLSLNLIECAFESGLNSPWLVYQKGLTLKAIGQFDEARSILEKLSKTQKKEKLQQAIKESLNNLDSDKEQFIKDRPKRVLRHCKAITEDHKWKNQHLPDSIPQGTKLNSRQLVIDESKAALDSGRSQLCIELLKACSLYYVNNRQGTLLQAEALFTVGENEKAISLLKELSTTKEDKYSRKAKAILSNKFTEKAKAVCIKKSPEQAITYYIEQHLAAELNPEYNQNLDEILTKIMSSSDLSSDQELRKHQLRIKFNNIFIDHLEAKLTSQKA